MSKREGRIILNYKDCAEFCRKPIRTSRNGTQGFSNITTVCKKCIKSQADPTSHSHCQYCTQGKLKSMLESSKNYTKIEPLKSEKTTELNKINSVKKIKKTKKHKKLNEALISPPPMKRDRYPIKKQPPMNHKNSIESGTLSVDSVSLNSDLPELPASDASYKTNTDDEEDDKTNIKSESEDIPSGNSGTTDETTTSNSTDENLTSDTTTASEPSTTENLDIHDPDSPESSDGDTISPIGKSYVYYDDECSQTSSSEEDDDSDNHYYDESESDSEY